MRWCFGLASLYLIVLAVATYLLGYFEDSFHEYYDNIPLYSTCAYMNIMFISVFYVFMKSGAEKFHEFKKKKTLEYGRNLPKNYLGLRK